MALVWLQFYPFCLQRCDSSSKNKMLSASMTTHILYIELIAGLDLGPPVQAPAQAAATQKKKKKKKK